MKPQQLKVLLLEPNMLLRSDLTSYINEAGIASQLAECKTGADLRALLKQGGFDLCFLGEGVPPDEKLSLLKIAKVDAPDLALVPVLGADAAQTSLSLFGAGAHALLTRPFDKDRLIQTVRVALDTLRKPAPKKEQITSLPWILESVARRLELLAGQVKEHEAVTGSHLPATPEAVREALINALSTSSSATEDFQDGLIDRLDQLTKQKQSD